VAGAVLPKRVSRIARALSIDVALLRRRREFGLLTAGQVVSQIGSTMTFVALPVQCYAQTHSTLTVGLLGAVEFVPILFLALVGGAMADGFDRRLLVMAAEAATLLVSLGLIVNASLAAPTTWFLFVAAALSAAFDALRRPPLDALLPQLVEPGDMKSALALSSGLGSLAALIGPAIAGVAIASLGFAGASSSQWRRSQRSAHPRGRPSAAPPACARRSTPCATRAGAPS
jgi:MFS family permease